MRRKFWQARLGSPKHRKSFGPGEKEETPLIEKPAFVLTTPWPKFDEYGREQIITQGTPLCHQFNGWLERLFAGRERRERVDAYFKEFNSRHK
jgi:hypothetical protein